jgi:hypothetical protein
MDRFNDDGLPVVFHNSRINKHLKLGCYELGREIQHVNLYRIETAMNFVVGCSTRPEVTLYKYTPTKVPILSYTTAAPTYRVPTYLENYYRILVNWIDGIRFDDYVSNSHKKQLIEGIEQAVYNEIFIDYGGKPVLIPDTAVKTSLMKSINKIQMNQGWFCSETVNIPD